MQNIDYITLQAFFEENIDFFIGARLQKIQQPTRKDFIFQLRNNGESRKFYININPQFYHVAFISKENEERRGISIPKQPPMFCMLLRKYLEGCKISDACVIEDERILELHFETMDEFSQKRSLCLCVELMGKHSNVILYDRETKVIIGCAHNVGPEKSRYRELQGGQIYIYPPLALNKFEGIPLYKTFDNNLPLNENLDSYFATIQEGINIKGGKCSLTEIVTPKLKRVKNSIDKITQLLKKRDKTEEYKLYGELLTANLYQKKDYSKSIEVKNYFTGLNIVIELDETKTLNENAQRYFKLYTKSKTTKEKSEQMLAELEIERDYLENVLYSIEKAENLKELEEIKSELGIVQPYLQPTSHKTILNRFVRQSPLEREHSLLKLDINGFEVFVGKNNKQNDYIISKLSKDEDYWFHTRLCAGSHVLLKVRETEPDEATIFECCKLAREYSSATQPSKIGVIYTKRKFIKKPPKAPLGYVIYKNEKEVLV
ncbi:MAG: fibronectin-binding domain-containing protein [Cyanobacteria bacterium SIG31]|nr:fibronectin-binding domain-containing protein [Cyanobacteria bacterium SIG31]